MQIPIITSISPCFNHGKWVQDSLKSIVNQDYQNLRMMFVDDCSTDDSFEKACELVENLRNLQILPNNPVSKLKGGNIGKYPIILAKLKINSGPSFCRNYGINTAWDGSELFALLDCDDEYLLGKIQKSVDRYLEYPDLIGLVYSDYITENTTTGLLCREFKPPYNQEHLLRECIVNSDSIISKKAFANGTLFPESLRLCEDFYTWLVLSRKNMFYHIPEPLVKIRVGKHSSTDNNSTKLWEDSYRQCFEMFQKYNINNP